jgi:hypothetical protein
MDTGRLLIVLVPLTVVVAACLAGVARADRDLPDWRALLCTLAVTVAAGVLISTWRDPEVDGDTFAVGVLIGSVLLGGAPVLAYYRLGRALAGHRIVLTVLFLLSLAPLGFYLFMVLLFTLGAVHCPPDAYECPL